MRAHLPLPPPLLDAPPLPHYTPLVPSFLETHARARGGGGGGVGGGGGGGGVGVGVTGFFVEDKKNFDLDENCPVGGLWC